jgi:hypothetical protein
MIQLVTVNQEHHVRAPSLGIGDMTCIAWNPAADRFNFMFATGFHDGCAFGLLFQHWHHRGTGEQEQAVSVTPSHSRPRAPCDFWRLFSGLYRATHYELECASACQRGPQRTQRAVDELRVRHFDYSGKFVYHTRAKRWLGCFQCLSI